MSERKCCYLQDGKAAGKPCKADAEWELHGSNEPMCPVDACTKHVGDLLDDSVETKIYPLPCACATFGPYEPSEAANQHFSSDR